MNKKLAALVLSILLVAAPAGIALGLSGSPAAPSNAAKTDPQTVAKDETVYFLLDASGTLTGTDVVNRIDTPAAGFYTDYGVYASVVNLTNDAQPQVSGDEITWQLDAEPKGFYYQGSLADAQPPLLVAVTYTLDGQAIAPAELAGKSGKVAIHVETKPNGAANQSFVKNYFTQIQASLDLDRCRDLDAQGATTILTGRSKSLAYTVMPGKSGSFTISFITDEFSFGGFTMTAMPFDQKAMTGIDTEGMREDIDKMADGARELVDGTSELRDGLKELADGVDKLADGSAGAKSGLSTYRGGVKDYTNGVAALSAKAKGIAASLNGLAAGGQEFKTSYTQLSGSVIGLLDTMSPLAPPEMAGQITTLKERLTGYGDGLGDYLDGITKLAAGMQAFSDGLAKLKGGNPELLSGLDQIINGMASLSDGLATTSKELTKLPGEVQKLVDGQTEFKDGIDEAGKTFDKFDFGNDPNAALVSYVSDRNHPRSVQFIYKTADISLPEQVEPAQQAAQDKGFFEKLADLFR